MSLLLNVLANQLAEDLSLLDGVLASWRQRWMERGFAHERLISFKWMDTASVAVWKERYVVSLASRDEDLVVASCDGVC